MLATDGLFGRGLPQAGARSVFEPVLLPDEVKRDLCLGLLEEFGAHVHESGGELIHGCMIGVHHDQRRNPTASLNYESLTFHCFGCQASGGILWFIATVRGCTTAEALEWLNGQTGLGGRELDVETLMSYFDALYRGKVSEPIPTYSDQMLEPWRAVHPYLTDPVEQGGRGIPEQTVAELGFGYAPQYEVSEGVFSERIVLPHYWRGKLVGWQTRRLTDDGTAKYLSSPGFPKDRTIYHYDPRAERTVVVEAMLSVASKTHLAHCEATFGASLADEQVVLLAKHSQVVLFMDNDLAGWESTERLGDELSRTGVVMAVENPWSADPADLSDEDFVALVSNAVPYSIWGRPRETIAYTRTGN